MTCSRAFAELLTAAFRAAVCAEGDCDSTPLEEYLDSPPASPPFLSPEAQDLIALKSNLRWSTPSTVFSARARRALRFKLSMQWRSTSRQAQRMRSVHPVQSQPDVQGARPAGCAAGHCGECSTMIAAHIHRRMAGCITMLPYRSMICVGLIFLCCVIKMLAQYPMTYELLAATGLGSTIATLRKVTGSQVALVMMVLARNL